MTYDPSEGVPFEKVTVIVENLVTGATRTLTMPRTSGLVVDWIQPDPEINDWTKPLRSIRTIPPKFALMVQPWGDEKTREYVRAEFTDPGSEQTTTQIAYDPNFN